ncbi:hypothetical protein B0T26DRAFT_750667 [Lasiosphaeria miniovina]|uniref:Uncharacterized protein n=1 Tax=Lasiosphaeria miniovina TaxID=1954250 RepID=A0AA40E5N7_9PEZI|nr:uncharacterized protein B0T26DRAFT_750667 [Lasiosphaeria miniovina]KAK0723393.1 hypothetical protein B0T26DRAFT_750667 [Lasiosphaeria miniovina]
MLFPVPVPCPIERDNKIAEVYGLEKPYILFSRHHWMSMLENIPGLTAGQKFNEMVYLQVQNALCFGEPCYINADAYTVCVDWKVWEPVLGNKPTSARIVSQGSAYTTSDIDFTVKVGRAGGRKAFTLYNFQFTICGSDKASALGRTSTSPATNDDVSLMNLAVFSGSNYRGSPRPINKVKTIADDASQAHLKLGAISART